MICCEKGNKEPLDISKYESTDIPKKCEEYFEIKFDDYDLMTNDDRKINISDLSKISNQILILKKKQKLPDNTISTNQIITPFHETQSPNNISNTSSNFTQKKNTTEQQINKSRNNLEEERSSEKDSRKEKNISDDNDLNKEKGKIRNEYKIDLKNKKKILLKNYENYKNDLNNKNENSEENNKDLNNKNENSEENNNDLNNKKETIKKE